MINSIEILFPNRLGLLGMNFIIIIITVFKSRFKLLFNEVTSQMLCTICSVTIIFSVYYTLLLVLL